MAGRPLGVPEALASEPSLYFVTTIPTSSERVSLWPWDVVLELGGAAEVEGTSAAKLGSH